MIETILKCQFLLLVVILNGCTHVETKKRLSMDDLLNMPTEQLFNVSVEKKATEK